MTVSSNYRELNVVDAWRVAGELYEAWKDDSIPRKQFELCTRPEMDRIRRGEIFEPFAALIRCLRRLPVVMNQSAVTMLDVGAASGFYGEVIKQAGFQFHYTALDFSPAFKELAAQIYPGLKFIIADARGIPSLDAQFDIVLSSAVMMHCVEYELAFSEAVRVSKRYVLLHRTPVLTTRPTSYFVKDAYGVPCIEIHFGESELFELFIKYGVTVAWQDEVFWDEKQSFGHRSYLLKKDSLFHIGL
jgi:SAM-dependent methyltransferase